MLQLRPLQASTFEILLARVRFSAIDSEYYRQLYKKVEGAGTVSSAMSLEQAPCEVHARTI